MAETPGDARLEQLERRVRSDPMSVAFAALAEEYRRAGRFDEAIETCRAGLTRHPAYLSARVTLGRALMETGALEEAEGELQRVVEAAPENLAAIRCLAEIHHRRGDDHDHDAPPASAPASPPAPAAEPPAPPADPVAAPEPIAAAAADEPEPTAAPAEPVPAYGEIVPETPALEQAADAAPDDPVIADLEDFLGRVVSAREARDGPASR